MHAPKDSTSDGSLSIIDQSTPFIAGTILTLKKQGGVLPATLETFQKYFPGNRLELLTVAEYGELELILKPIIDNPYSVETLAGFRDTAETLLRAKLDKKDDYISNTMAEIARMEESDSDFHVPVYDDNTTRFLNKKPDSLAALCDMRRSDGVDRRVDSILTPLRMLIANMRKGENISHETMDRIIDPIITSLGLSMYASKSAIKLRQGGRLEGSHLPMVAADAFYRSEAYTAFSKRMTTQMEQLFSQAQDILGEYRTRIWKTDEDQENPAISMVSKARVERIFRNELLQEEDRFYITALYRDVVRNLNEMRKIMDGYRKSGKGVDTAAIEGFLSKNSQFHLCINELNMKLGGTTMIRGTDSSLVVTRLLPFNQ